MAHCRATLAFFHAGYARAPRAFLLPPARKSPLPSSRSCLRSRYCAIFCRHAPDVPDRLTENDNDACMMPKSRPPDKSAYGPKRPPSPANPPTPPLIAEGDARHAASCRCQTAIAAVALPLTDGCRYFREFQPFAESPYEPRRPLLLPRCLPQRYEYINRIICSYEISQVTVAEPPTDRFRHQRMFVTRAVTAPRNMPTFTAPREIQGRNPPSRRTLRPSSPDRHVNNSA